MENIIYIEGVIGEDVTVGTVRSQYEALSNPKDVTVKINSGGGDVDEGFAIYDFLTTLGVKVNTEVLGMCGSIATIIQQSACNGGERAIHQNSKDFIHNPYWQNNAPIPMEAKDAKDLYERLMITENKILSFYVQHTKTSAEVLKAKMDAQTELTAQEALDLGLVDRIITSDVIALRNYKVIALIKTETKTNTMAELKSEFKAGFEKLEKLFSKLIKTKNEMATTDAGVSVFYDGSLEVGTQVFSDEVMTVPFPDGDFVVAGVVYTVVGGAVSAVATAVVDKTELEIANEKIAALEATLAAKETEVVNAKAEVTTALNTAVEIEKEFVALKNQIVAGGKEIFNAPIVDKPSADAPKKSLMDAVLELRKAKAEKK